MAVRFDRDGLEEAGFAGFVRFGDLLAGELASVPTTPGVYVVFRSVGQEPIFSAVSRGGHFKKRDPVAMVEELQAKWVPGAGVLYIGKAEVLRRRLKEYARFGRGDPIGHWGGRYIWQLADCYDLLVAWRATVPDETAFEAEAHLLAAFKRRYEALPFANLSEPRPRSA